MEISYLEGTVHQRLIQVYDHADLSLVLVFHGGQEAEFMLLSGQDRHTPQHWCVSCEHGHCTMCERYSFPGLTFISQPRDETFVSDLNRLVVMTHEGAPERVQVGQLLPRDAANKPPLPRTRLGLGGGVMLQSEWLKGLGSHMC